LLHGKKEIRELVPLFKTDISPQVLIQTF
jgi:hypothetical protein